MKYFNPDYFNLLKEIAVCQFKLKDQSTFFGFLWSFLHPLIILLVLFLFFHWRMETSAEHYSIFLLIGIIHFTHFCNSTSASMTVLESMKQITCNVVMPKELLVMGSVLANTLEFCISMPICIGIAYVTGVHLSRALTLLPLLYFAQIMMVLWVSFLMSCLFVFVKDIGHIYQVFLRVLFFITPIFYAPDFLGNGIARYILPLNPLAQVVQFSRDIIIRGDRSSADSFLAFTFGNVVLVLVSFFIFKRCERRFAEHV